MATISFSIAVALVIVLLFTGLLKLWNVYWRQPRKLLNFCSKQGIPGCPFVPIVGQLPLLKASMENPPVCSAGLGTFYDAFVEKFGYYFTFGVGPDLRLVVADPEFTRTAYVSLNEKLDKTEFLRSIEILGSGLLTSSGKLWAQQRKNLTQAFAYNSIKSMMITIVDASELMLENWVDIPQTDEGKVLDVKKEFAILTLDIITRTAFGGVDHNEAREISIICSNLIPRSTKQAQLKQIIPGFGLLPLPINLALARELQTLRNKMEGLITRRQEMEGIGATGQISSTENSSAAGSECRDLLDVMMAAAKQGHSPSVDKKQLIDECMTFLIAGHETTANLLVWVVVLLSQNPEWQERVRKEVLEVCGIDKPTFEQLSELKSLLMVIRESLRLYPPVPVISRVCSEQTTISKYIIPAGLNLLFPICVLHRRKDLWGEDADEFRPERFANGTSKAASHPASFLPFSLGPRSCIGQHFATVESKVILAMLLQRWRWRLSDTYVHCPMPGLSLRPKHTVPIILERL